MRFVDEFSLAHIVDLAASLGVAFVLAVLIGAERQWRQRSAGLRTNVLVAVGAAAFVSLGMRLNGASTDKGAPRTRPQPEARLPKPQPKPQISPTWQNFDYACKNARSRWPGRTPPRARSYLRVGKP